jgi:hypothetical protein
MSTHWFHDHMIDHTAENVYKGNATMMNYYSALDRGNEAIDDGVNLRFPSGTALNWGNRDYDVNLLVADKAWDGQGQLWFNTLEVSDGFLGDHAGQLALQALLRRARPPLPLPHPQRLGVALSWRSGWCSRSPATAARCRVRRAPTSPTTGCPST